MFRYPVFLVLISLITACATRSPLPADLIIGNVRLYTAPGAPPLEAASIAIRDGKIAELGIGIPAKGEKFIDGKGRAATAGLWNSHVHFMDPALKTDAKQVVRNMLLRYGFTNVLDTGSELSETVALSWAIEAGELFGPKIFMANGSFVYTDATPTYLPGIRLPELAVPSDAAPLVDAVMQAGAQGIKIFSGSFMSPVKTIHLPPDIIHAVTQAAHARGGFVIAHPNDRTGLINAVDNGVDILAHTAPGPKPLGDKLIGRMLANRVALIPTLKLWSYELRRSGTPEKAVQAVQKMAIAQLAEYHSAGGEILFGTDAGYMTDFNTKDEFSLMKKAGMNFDEILASLTTNPAQRFAPDAGILALGAPADIVIYSDDPGQDVTAFSRVDYTIRGGKPVYCRNKGDSACR